MGAAIDTKMTDRWADSTEVPKRPPDYRRPANRQVPLDERGFPQPKNVVVLLLDSLNRHMLESYGGTEFATPNLSRFAKRAIRFQRHYTGSLPCMPARHDLLCGALDFLWKPWGSAEVWERTVTDQLRRVGVTSALVTDHPHLFEVGGENYHCAFTAWDYQRGGEGDPWKTRPDPSWQGAPNFKAGWMPYDNSRGWFRGEQDFPGPRTMTAASEWLRLHGSFHERFLLFVDEFDPHEPFDSPEPYASLYDTDWKGPHLIWPPYSAGAVAGGMINERQARQIRASYGAKLTMIDVWLGRVLDALDEHDFWRDTAIFLLSDHGIYLGEKDIWGKPPVPVYETLGHIPLMVAWPGLTPGNCDALTTSVDIFATLLDIFGVHVPQRVHGHSLVPLLRNDVRHVRDYVLTGVWGREINIIHDTTKYSRAPAKDNAPLSMWSNRWSTMPRYYAPPDIRLPMPDGRATLRQFPGTNVPVIYQPFGVGDFVPWQAFGDFSGNHLYDVAADPWESNNLAGTRREKVEAGLLRDALLEIEAPSEQLVRLGLN
ncbi:MAG: sulfatase-like hydrolase/transferase [Candidatus Dormibacteraceae bacterium]